MDTTFKNVNHNNEVIYGYELKDVLAVSGWDQKISGMFERLDLAVLQKCWTSILFSLPITIVMIGDKSNKNKVILDNFREIDALMTIYRFNPRGEKLYLDPMSCELSLEKSENFIALENVYDTFKLIELIKDICKLNLDDKETEAIIDNLKHINKKLQTLNILFHELLDSSSDKTRLASFLNQFYKDLYAYI